MTGLLLDIATKGKIIDLSQTYAHEMSLLPSANEVCEDYVFTRVCLSTEGEGGVPGQVHPLPPQRMLGYGQKAGGTHPLECILVSR